MREMESDIAPVVIQILVLSGIKRLVWLAYAKILGIVRRNLFKDY
jgi:hypothetical protein